MWVSHTEVDEDEGALCLSLLGVQNLHQDRHKAQYISLKPGKPIRNDG